tara:strand:+ start:2698 stop:2976 length:279 start_codon:yes stop_codon:yes gene_type:complete
MTGNNGKDSDLFNFPCDFSIKIIGDAQDGFKQEILTIARKHHPELADEAIAVKLSKEGNYIAISVTVFAQSQASLDALYADLVKHPNTKMVL